MRKISDAFLTPQTNIENNNAFIDKEQPMNEKIASISIQNPAPRMMPEAIPQSYTMLPQKEDKEKKSNFLVTALPSAIIGAIIGGALSRAKTENPIAIAPYPPKNNDKDTHTNRKTFLQADYYQQMSHLSQNLKIIFTPLSVVFVVKDGMQNVPLDTIETEEMNDSMLDAWRRRDTEYYRNLLFNKMNSEIQYAEKAFAKRIVENQLNLRESFTKKASANRILEDAVDTEDMTDVELFAYTMDAEAFFEKEGSVIEKIASCYLDELDDDPIVIASAKFDHDFEKYAGCITDKLTSFSLKKAKDNISSAQGKFLNPSYLDKNLHIGFFPDRVVFSVDGVLISTLPVFGMNEEGFEHFKQRDQEFFREFFSNQTRKGIARLNEKKSSLFNVGLEKNASEKIPDIKDIFVEPDVHPAVYLLALISKYGFEWVDFDNNALLSILEKDFFLTRPIADIPLNKIMSIKIANQSDNVFLSRHAFEKVIRSMNNLPIDFLKRESEDLGLREFIIGLEALNRVTPYDNIYDNFSPEVYDYMVKILADKEIYYWGVSATGTDEEAQFLITLNYSLLSELNRRFALNSSSQKEADEVTQSNEAILQECIYWYPFVQDALAKKPDFDFIAALRKQLSDKKYDREIIEVIIRQIVKNVAIDIELDKREEELKLVLRSFGLSN